ncbi:hypothetical protein P7C70_g733, partial [Phenoliferia sp. Uapishka_3]
MPHKRAKKSVRETATATRGYDVAPSAIDIGPNPLASTSSSADTTSTEIKVNLGTGVFAPKDEGRMKKKRVLPKDRVNAFGGRNDMGGMSKSAYRILNAGAVREEYHASKKRKLEEDEAAAAKGKKGKKTLEMLPYESLAAFNRRVEVALRPSIDSAIRGAKASSAKGKKEKVLAKKERAAALAAAALAKKEAEEEALNPGGAAKKKAPVDPFVPPVKERPVREFEEASQRKMVGDVVMAPPTLKKPMRKGDAGPSAHDAMPAGRMPVSDNLKKIMEAEREKAVRMYRDMKEKRDKAQEVANHS